jgi:hypothetical protein
MLFPIQYENVPFAQFVRSCALCDEARGVGLSSVFNSQSAVYVYKFARQGLRAREMWLNRDKFESLVRDQRRLFSSQLNLWKKEEGCQVKNNVPFATRVVFELARAIEDGAD